MVPLEGWYHIEESVSPCEISCMIGSGEWASERLVHMDARQGQSSWIPYSEGRKRFHRDIPLKTFAIVSREQIPNMTGEQPLQDLLPLLTGGWSDQMLADVLHVSTSQSSVGRGQHVTNLTERLTRSQDVDTATVDSASTIYTEDYNPNFATRLLLTDENSNGGGSHKITSEFANDFALINCWDPRRSITDYPNEKDLRNQETLLAAETSNADGQNLWSTSFCTLARDTGGVLPSARSVSSEGRHLEIEVKVEQNSRGEVPNLIPDRNGHMQGIREAVSSLGGHGVETAVSRPTALLEQPQLSEFNRRGGSFDTKSPFLPSTSFLEDGPGQSSRFPTERELLATGTQKSQIPFHDGNGLSNFAGSVETLVPPHTVAVSTIQPEPLSMQVPSASPLSILPPANKCNLLGGSNQSSQVPRLPLHLTPSLQHPPQPKEQMVQQSFTISTQNQNDCSSASLAFQENFQSKLASGIGQNRVQQLQNRSWQQVMNCLEYDAIYKQRQQILPQGPPLDMEFHGVGSDGSGSAPDWTSNEALVIQQLQATTLQLDVGTRMCIRDALYRLATSAKERSCRAHNISQDLPEPDNATFNSCITGEGPFDSSRCESETHTNHLDRSIASLLFSTGPFRKCGQQSRSVSQPLPGGQNGPWLWSSTGTMGNNWSPSSCKYSGAPRIPPGNSLTSIWGASTLVNGCKSPNPTAFDSRADYDSFMHSHKLESPDNYQPLEMQVDRLNMPLSSCMRSQDSAHGALNLDRSTLPYQSAMITEGMRPEGSTRGQENREVDLDLDVDRTFPSGFSIMNLNYQSALMPYKGDVGNDVAAIAPSLRENCRVVNRYYDGAGNFESKLSLERGPSQFTHPDGYGRTNGGHMFGGDMNSIATNHSIDPSGKEELGIEVLWHGE